MDILHKYRTSLLAAITKGYDEFEGELQAELARRDAITAQEVQKFQGQALPGHAQASAGGTGLDGDGDAAADDRQRRPTGAGRSSRAENASAHEGTSTHVPRPAYDDLLMKFDTLKAQYDAVCQAHVQITDYHRREKSKIADWQRYIRRWRERHPHRSSKKDGRGSTTVDEASVSAMRRSSSGRDPVNPEGDTGEVFANRSIPSLPYTLTPPSLDPSEPGSPQHDTGPDAVSATIPDPIDSVIHTPQGSHRERLKDAASYHQHGSDTDALQSRRSPPDHPEALRHLVYPPADLVERAQAEVQQHQENLLIREANGESRVDTVVAAADDLVLISSRRVRKRRRVAVDDRKSTRPSPGRAKLKSEQASDSHVAPLACERPQEVPDSLDLDDVGARVATPRKRRRPDGPLDHCPLLLEGALVRDEGHGGGQYQASSFQASTRGKLGLVRSVGLSNETTPGHSDLMMKEDPESTERSRPSSRSFPSAGLMSNDMITRAAELRGTGTDDDPTRTVRTSSEPSEPDRPSMASPTFASKVAMPNAVLQPRTTNARVLPRTRSDSASRKRSNSGNPPWKVLAEDGGAYPSAAGHVTEDPRREAARSKGLSSSTLGANVHARLDRLLHEPFPDGSPLQDDASHSLTKPAVQAIGDAISDRSRSTTSKSHSTAPSTPRGVAPQIKAKSTTRRKRCLQDQAISVASDPDCPEEEPYRALPVHRLSLEHFKVNPDYNEGRDYAFSETVRKREQRQCLVGCTRSGCCGSAFRKMVEFGLPPAPSSSLRWRSPSPTADEEARGGREEERLLRWHLGIDAAQIARMSRPERCEAVVQARTKQLADRHGRHRYAFERRMTPPGFWRTEMPTTQELEEDREDARRAERQKIEERRREALRPGSRWKFRDE